MVELTQSSPNIHIYEGMFVTSEKTTLAICLLMNSFSQLSFNKNICDTLYLNLFKLSYSFIFWLQWIMIFINYISLKIFRLSIISYVKKIINVTRNFLMLTRYIVTSNTLVFFIGFFLGKILCNLLLFSWKNYVTVMCITLEWTYSVVDLDTSRMIVTLT